MDKITELLTRSVEEIYPRREALEKVLRTGKKLRLYQGFDPTGTKLHIGHAVALMKLREFQELGHHVIFLIGDGTGQAGDPSGKTQARDRFLTREELRANARDYVQQAAKIVRFDELNPVEILYNGDWLNKLTLVDMLEIAQHFSVQQLVERDMFQDRIKRGESINLREFLYPLLQGYDSVAMDVDLEIGGTDQTFNMLAGRTLMAALKKKEKFVLTVPLLTDSSGRKIGKTEGNVIGIADPPNDLFGKIMSLSDDVIVKGFEFLTRVPMKEIQEMEKQLKENKANPMDLKKKLGYTLVTHYHSKEAAGDAQSYFEQTIQNKELPNENVRVHILKSGVSIGETAVESGLVQSKSELKRLVEQGGLYLNNERISHEALENPIHDGDFLRRGSHTIVKIQIL